MINIEFSIGYDESNLVYIRNYSIYEFHVSVKFTNSLWFIKKHELNLNSNVYTKIKSNQRDKPTRLIPIEFDQEIKIGSYRLFIKDELSSQPPKIDFP